MDNTQAAGASNEQLLAELLELGFEEGAIKKALALTQNKEQAIELILTFQDDSKPATKSGDKAPAKKNNKQPKPQQQQQQAPPQQQQQQQAPQQTAAGLDSATQNLVNTLTSMSVEQLLNLPRAGEGQDEDAEDDDEDFEDVDDDKRYKMVILVRQDLKMGTGKIAAQVGHGVLGAYQNAQERIRKGQEDVEDALIGWENSGGAKIVVRVNSQDEMLEIQKRADEINLNNCLIVDYGRTQVAPNTMTVLALGPAEESVIDQLTKHLKLL